MSISRGGGDLIAAIYNSIIEPAGWDGVVKRIVEATKSVSGWLSIKLADEEHLPGQHNIDPFYADSLATMHLTNKELIHSDALAASDHSDAAGAPANEIEITPEMIEVGVEAFYKHDLNDPEIYDVEGVVRAVFLAMYVCFCKSEARKI
jgi:hypothetical protein